MDAVLGRQISGLRRPSGQVNGLYNGFSGRTAPYRPPESVNVTLEKCIDMSCLSLLWFVSEEALETGGFAAVAIAKYKKMPSMERRRELQRALGFRFWSRKYEERAEFLCRKVKILREPNSKL